MTIDDQFEAIDVTLLKHNRRLAAIETLFKDALESRTPLAEQGLTEEERRVVKWFRSKFYDRGIIGFDRIIAIIDRLSPTKASDSESSPTTAGREVVKHCGNPWCTNGVVTTAPDGATHQCSICERKSLPTTAGREVEEIDDGTVLDAINAARNPSPSPSGEQIAEKFVWSFGGDSGDVLFTEITKAEFIEALTTFSASKDERLKEVEQLFRDTRRKLFDALPQINEWRQLAEERHTEINTLESELDALKAKLAELQQANDNIIDAIHKHTDDAWVRGQIRQHKQKMKDILANTEGTK